MSGASIVNESLLNQSFPNGTQPNATVPYPTRPDLFAAYVVLFVTGSIQIVGIIGNALVVICISADKKLHTVTFVILAALAVADGIALCSYLISSVFQQLQPSVSAIIAGLALSNAAFFSSAFHVLYISIVRYLILIHPLKTYIYLKTRYMIVISILIYVISGVIAGVDVIVKDTFEYVVGMWTIYYVPLVIMIILHGIKFYHLKHNRFQQSSLNNSSTMKNMTKIILFITLSSFLLPLPSCVLQIMTHLGWRFKTEVKMAVILVFTCNNCINPFLYCFLSPKFRSSVKECCCCICRRKSRKGSRSTSMTVTTGSSNATSRTSSIQKDNSISETPEDIMNKL